MPPVLVPIRKGDAFLNLSGDVVKILDADMHRVEAFVPKVDEHYVLTYPAVVELISSGAWKRLTKTVGSFSCTGGCGATSEYQSGPYLCWACKNKA